MFIYGLATGTVSVGLSTYSVSMAKGLFKKKEKINGTFHYAGWSGFSMPWFSIKNKQTNMVL